MSQKTDMTETKKQRARIPPGVVPGDPMKIMLQLVAGAFLALFAGLWIWIAWKVWRFDSNGGTEALEFSDAIVATAGIVASAVAAGTAAVLGIEIQRRSGRLSARVNSAVASSPLLFAGVVAYIVVGGLNLVVWLGNSDAAPDMVGTFALGALGWLAGAFASVFSAD
jgi:hypothetical protein